MALNAIKFENNTPNAFPTKEKKTPVELVQSNSNVQLEKEVKNAIASERQKALNLEDARHTETVKKINKLYDDLLDLEKDRLVAFTDAKKQAKSDIDEIKLSIKERFETMGEQVKGVTSAFEMQKNKALQSLENME